MITKTISRLFVLSIFLVACGGGGGSNTTVSSNNVTTQSDADQPGRQLSFETDIEPIMQGKCLGCHNSGDNPLAPFSLAGVERANAFKSAIHFALESQTMPPAGARQLTGIERNKLLAWASNGAYNPETEILRIALVEPKAWDVQPLNQDAFLDHRPGEVACARGTGWLVEDDELEVRTEFCNYLSVTQQSLLDLEAGTELELAMTHSDLNFNAPATAHVALSIGGNTIWERTIDIPGAGKLLKERLVLPSGVRRGDSIEVHLHNHGDNAWTIHSLFAFVAGDAELNYCPSFDNTFDAIQAVVFEQAGCTNSLCHGEASEGGLDLTALNAFDNLVGAPAEGSSLALVEPRKPSLSYLYHKLSAKTFPDSYAIDGSPMPSAGTAISPGQLEAIRLWIEAGAPREGSVGDSLGRGEDEIENLLGVCLPEADAVNTTPLPPPDPDKGIQFAMPPHDVPAEKEREICFAIYEDFRDVIPAQYMDETGDNFFVKGGKTREDAFTHHNLIYKPLLPVEMIHDPSFGEWTCAGGDSEGNICEPTDLQSCGTGKCRAELKNSIACRGYGPQTNTSGPVLGLGTGIEKAGFYTEYPAHGIFYWNSHAFNLTTKDGVHHVWRNIYFADNRRFRARAINVTRNIFVARGTPPFEKKTVCRDYVLDQGDGLLRLSSHTHKRGERFFMKLKSTGEQIYETFTYDEPLIKTFEPPLVFNTADAAERTIEYCATYNNGVNSDGSPNIETVTRLSRRPTNAFGCKPIACVAGKIGASCNGKDDNASCDSSPGAGDGWCDACAILGSFSSDDEMFILLGSKLPDHDALINAHAQVSPEVAISQPAPGDSFAPGAVLNLEFAFKHFELIPPEDHAHDDASMDHSDAGGDHDSVNAGHYHIYLDTEDDSADHVTAWSDTLAFTLPQSLEPGPHTIRISLRAPDHHAIDITDGVTILVD